MSLLQLTPDVQFLAFCKVRNYFRHDVNPLHWGKSKAASMPSIEIELEDGSIISPRTDDENKFSSILLRYNLKFAAVLELLHLWNFSHFFSAKVFCNYFFWLKKLTYSRSNAKNAKNAVISLHNYSGLNLKGVIDYFSNIL